MKQLFISHSGKDSDFASQLKIELEKVLSVDAVWLDVFDLDVGVSLGDKLSNVIDDSKWFVFIASKASVASRWVKEETSQAIIKAVEEDNFIIFTVKIEECELPLWARSRVFIESHDIEEIVDKLRRTLQRDLEGKEKGGLPFVNRFNEFNSIQLAVASGNKLIQIIGLHGIGKTSLIGEAHLAFQRRKAVFVEVKPWHDLHLLTRQLCGKAELPQPAVGAEDAELKQAAWKAVDALLKSGGIIVLDDVENALADSHMLPYLEEFCIDYINKEYQPPLILSASRKFEFPSQYQRFLQLIVIEGLSNQHLSQCLQNWYSVAAPGKQPLSQGMLDKIAPLLHGYPFAARLAAAKLASSSPEYLVSRLSHFNEISVQIAEQIIGDLRSDFHELDFLVAQALAIAEIGVSLSDLCAIGALQKYGQDDIGDSVDRLSGFLVLSFDADLIKLHPIVQGYFWKVAYRQDLWRRIAKDLAERFFHRADKLGELIKKKQYSSSNQLASFTQQLIRYTEACQRLFRMVGEHQKVTQVVYDFSGTVRYSVIRLYRAKEYELSIEYATIWLEKEPSDHQIRLYRARSLRRTKQFKKAKEETLELRNVRYLQTQVEHLLGLIARDQEDYRGAIAHFLKAFNQERRNYRRLVLERDLGDVYYRLGEYESALKYLKSANEKAPNDAFATPIYIDVLMAIGNKEDALRILDFALSAFPDNPAFNHQMAKILKDEGQFDSAYKYAMKAESRDDRKDIYFTAASIANKLGKYNEAIQRLKKVKVYGREEIVGNTILAEAYLGLGELNTAKDIMDAYAYAKGDSFILFLRAKIELEYAYQASNPSEAKMHADSAHEIASNAFDLYPNNVDLQKLLFDIDELYTSLKRSL